jgi:hypothetical protein
MISGMGGRDLRIPAGSSQGQASSQGYMQLPGHQQALLKAQQAQIAQLGHAHMLPHQQNVSYLLSKYICICCWTPNPNPNPNRM